MSEHRVTLGDAWMLWQWVGVRGAGFPARTVLQLAAPQSARAADALAMAEDQVAKARHQVTAVLEAALAGQVGKARNPVIRALKDVAAGRIPDVFDTIGGAAPALDQIRKAEDARAQAAAHLERAFTGEAAVTAQALRAMAGDARFREAIAWQNRRALHTGIDRVLSRTAAKSSKERKQDYLVANYLQRYCVKNDTIGFFGPMGWGAIDPARKTARIRPGARFLARRTVYFEYWAIDALAEKLAGDPALKPYLAPRRAPTVWVEGTTLHYPIDCQVEVSQEHARLLAACDGDTPARVIAGTLIADSTVDFTDEEEVYELLDELCARRLITWTLEIPTATAQPEHTLKTLLASAGPAGKPGLSALAQLEEKREAVVKAAGDPAALDAALGELDAAFERHTDQRATRSAGHMYAGRTIVYEDCRRDLALTLGRPFLTRLGATLPLILQSARWYTLRIATLYREALEQAFDELARELGSPTVDYIRFWDRIAPLFPEGSETGPFVHRAAEELQARWAEILAFDTTARRVSRDPGSLAEAVSAAFFAPHPGWPGARYHSVDLLIAAQSSDAVCRGDYCLVLGEVHPAVNNAAIRVAQNQHDDPDAIIAARQRDLPDPIVVPVTSRERVARADHLWLAPHNIDLELGTARSWRARDHVLAVGSLVVKRGAKGHVIVCERHGDRCFDLVQFFNHYLTAKTSERFDVIAPSPHVPRLTLGDVVVAREQWRFSPRDMPFAALSRGPRQFSAARRWAAKNEIPRHVFLKVPEEKKPVFVDFESPIYVEMMARIVRKASTVTVTEMLPSVSEAWLPDAAGRTYTSELRLVAVDPESWRAPG